MKTLKKKLLEWLLKDFVDIYVATIAKQPNMPYEGGFRIVMDGYDVSLLRKKGEQQYKVVRVKEVPITIKK